MSNKEIQALMALPELDKVIFVYHSMNLRRTEFNPQGLVSFMQANHLRIENVQDIVYATILVKLMSLNIIGVASSRSYTQVMATDIPDHVSSIMDEYAFQARTMMVVALHAYSLGNDFDMIPWDTWYESFTKVEGSYLDQERFELIVQLIASSRFFSEVPKLLTLDQIVSEHNVLKY
ncbi:hypothetical protein FRX31_023723 [Thalictrum thalictroides]|uniref:Uncharacterized protein n=1 Tax=Thalictrum thalictroides TaxID=46969 RepID=A0A7J6VPJ9_THATH|nr:hypothetical protein FRX31_023723 [Thalictrum thalictroides]